MLALTASFFLVEIIVGFVTNSLALVGDSYHMLSDVIAIAIGLASVRVSVNSYVTSLVSFYSNHYWSNCCSKENNVDICD